MVVYLDVLFAVNALMDGATLLAAARLGGVQVREMRLIFSAALGGGYAVLGAVWPVLTLAPLRLLAGLGLCMFAFGRERHLARLCVLYGVVAASFAGLAAALSAASGRRLLLSCGYYFAVPIQVLVLAAAVGYAARPPSACWTRNCRSAVRPRSWRLCRKIWLHAAVCCRFTRSARMAVCCCISGRTAC